MSEIGKSRIPAKRSNLRKATDSACGSYLKLRKEKCLRLAAVTNNEIKVRELIEAGVDVNACDDNFRSPLHLASSRGFESIVELLLKHGANPKLKDTVGNTPLHLASCTGNINVVRALLAAGADAELQDSRGCTPLQLAQGRLKLLIKCLKGAEPCETSILMKQVQSVIDSLLMSLDKVQAESIDAFHQSLSGFTPEDHINALLNKLENLSV